MRTRTENSDIGEVMMILGIDVGGSTTKIVGVEDGQIRSAQSIVAADPVTSLFGALGKYIYDNGIDLADISRIMLTGVGSAYVDGNLYGLPTGKVEEFTANAIGAGHGSGMDRMVVVSMGTGTSFISVDHGKFTHLGGLGIGGGTLQGLSKIIFKASDLDYVVSMAMRGKVSSVDLQVGDICREELPGLPLDATASNFGKADTAAQAEDVAAGVINMILQTVGSAANFISLGTGIKDFVLIGNLSLLPQCRSVFDRIGRLYGLDFHIPEHTLYRTALGAALYALKDNG